MKMGKQMMFTIALAGAVSLSLAGCGRDGDRTATGGADREAAEPYGADEAAPGGQDGRSDEPGRAAEQARRDQGGYSGEAARVGSANLSAADREFMMNAAKDGMAEVQMGRLAQQKGSTDAVKNYGNKLVEDHHAANDELKQLAGDLGVTLPDEVDQKHKAELDRLSNLSGQRFERAFMRHAVQAHKKDVAAFQREANQGQDPSVKAFASKHLPTLREHLEMAQNWSAKGRGSEHADRSGRQH